MFNTGKDSLPLTSLALAIERLQVDFLHVCPLCYAKAMAGDGPVATLDGIAPADYPFGYTVTARGGVVEPPDTRFQ